MACLAHYLCSLTVTRLAPLRRFGHVLAEGLPGKGLGSRALLEKLKTKFIMHDASYLLPIQLTGTAVALQELLHMVW